MADPLVKIFLVLFCFNSLMIFGVKDSMYWSQLPVSELLWADFILWGEWPNSLSALHAISLDISSLWPRVTVDVILADMHFSALSKASWSLWPSPMQLSLPLSHLLGLPNLCPRCSLGVPQLHTSPLPPSSWWNECPGGSVGLPPS